MISEARAPGPDESGPNRDTSAEINTFIDNFSFVGMNQADGTPRVVSVRTMRDAIFMSSAEPDDETIPFTANTRVVRVDAQHARATVVDVVHSPHGHHRGLLRTYIIDGLNGEPHVIRTGEDEFEARAVFGFIPPSEGYIKVYDSTVAGQWDGREAKRLVHEGAMDSRQWAEFSVAHKVDIALQMFGITIPDTIQDDIPS